MPSMKDTSAKVNRGCLATALLLSLQPANSFWVAPSSIVQRGGSSNAFATRAMQTSLTMPSASKAMRLSMSSEAVEEKLEAAEKLQAAAAALRAEAEALEKNMMSERKVKAEVSFKQFDTNNDGKVDFAELKAGLETILRRDFKVKLARKINRNIVSDEEVDRRIKEMPGGSLVPDDVLNQLLNMYDSNSDGALSVDEFRRTDEMRANLERIFALRQEEERTKRIALRESKLTEVMDSTTSKAAQSAAAAAGLNVPEGLELIEVNNGPPSTADKLLGMIPFLLPLMDSTIFGAHLFNTFPEQSAWLQPLVVLMFLYRSIPFGGIGAFFAMSAASNNPKINKLQRFNMRQAINLDIALFVPTVLFSLTNFIVNAAGGNGVDLTANGVLPQLAQSGSDVVFVAMFIACAYSIVSTAFGITPNKLPVFTQLNREYQFQQAVEILSKEQLKQQGKGGGDLKDAGMDEKKDDDSKKDQ